MKGNDIICGAGGITGDWRFGGLSIRVDLILIAVLVAAFSIRIYAIYLPGPYGDEISFVLPAYPMKWGHLPATPSVDLLGHHLPLTVNPHTGALPVYLQFAFSYVTGKYWFGYRIMDIFYAIATSALVYWLARDLFGRRVAFLTAALVLHAVFGILQQGWRTRHLPEATCLDDDAVLRLPVVANQQLAVFLRSLPQPRAKHAT